MRTRPRYLPLFEVEPGMVLGAPVRVINHGYLSLSLPIGHELNDDSLHQLVAHGAQALFVLEADSRPDEQIAVDAAAAAKRVMKIFEGADLSNPTMASFFDQVLVYRSE
ncbi:MAG: hypothetical protein WCI39_01950 [Gallionellaceae bacterium]